MSLAVKVIDQNIQFGNQPSNIPLINGVNWTIIGQDQTTRQFNVYHSGDAGLTWAQIGVQSTFVPQPSFISIWFPLGGNLYVSYIDQTNNQLTVQKFDVGTATWTTTTNFGIVAPLLVFNTVAHAISFPAFELIIFTSTRSPFATWAGLATTWCIKFDGAVFGAPFQLDINVPGISGGLSSWDYPQAYSTSPLAAYMKAASNVGSYWRQDFSDAGALGAFTTLDNATNDLIAMTPGDRYIPVFNGNLTTPSISIYDATLGIFSQHLIASPIPAVPFGITLNGSLYYWFLDANGKINTGVATANFMQTVSWTFTQPTFSGAPAPDFAVNNVQLIDLSVPQALGFGGWNAFANIGIVSLLPGPSGPTTTTSIQSDYSPLLSLPNPALVCSGRSKRFKNFQSEQCKR